MKQEEECQISNSARCVCDAIRTGLSMDEMSERTLGLEECRCCCCRDPVDVILLFLNRVPRWYIPTRIDRHHHRHRTFRVGDARIGLMEPCVSLFDVIEQCGFVNVSQLI